MKFIDQTVPLIALLLALSSQAEILPAPIDLPDGLVAELVAAPPLVLHPIMAALGERGQLFVGDSSGTNLNKAGLEKALPHRVVLLSDTNGDGVYDRSTVFADKMTFPQGGVWLKGSLYVASPPGIWRLTDTNADGVADRREMMVGGYEFTGNAADVHGPFLHPNGRLYWCHGRKGHRVTQSDGTLVHSGLASGIWSCRPDGSDVRWHALASADNPVEIDFTPEGEIIGTVNLYYNSPRGDTIMHWLRGGVYPREDELEAIAGLPRTLDTMPVVHNFGHVAVSGCAFYRSGALNPDWRGSLFVAHFNTQRVSRMEFIPEGATFKAVEHEFLTLHNPDAHLTDVLEDRDGTLLVVDTGGWFRIGCPSSMMAKPEVYGGVYRIRSTGKMASVEGWGNSLAKVWELARSGDAAAVSSLIAMLRSDAPGTARAAANALASLASPESANALRIALDSRDPAVQLAAAHALGSLPVLDAASVGALLRRLERDVDPAVEHQAMDALIRAARSGPLMQALADERKPALQRRALVMLDPLTGSPLSAGSVVPLLGASDRSLAGTAARVVMRHRDWIPSAVTQFSAWLNESLIPADRLALIEIVATPWLTEPPVRDLVSRLLNSADPAQLRSACRILASAAAGRPESRWIAPLQAGLITASRADQTLLIDALAKAQTSETSAALRRFASDERHPLGLRIKALGAALNPGTPLPEDSYTLLSRVIADGTIGSAQLESARILATARLSSSQLLALAPAVATLGPLELRELLKAFDVSRDAGIGIALAKSLNIATSLPSLQESEIRTLLSHYPPEVYATVSPALRRLAAADTERRRKVETWPTLVAAHGIASEGQKVFESGKGACTACHRVGTVGNLVGPNLTAIGSIRTERDLLESILFPSNTLARDHEAYAIETGPGQSIVGVIRKSLPEAIVVADATGQEHTLARREITSMHVLPNSLMPDGLDRSMSEEELRDLVAFLRSRK